MPNFFYIVILFLLTISFPSSILADSRLSGLQDKLSRILADSAIDQAIVALEVRDVSNQKTIFSRNARKSMVPASILKLVTTGVALELLDSSFIFSTRIGYRGFIDSSGLLCGNVLVVGGGDPTLGSQYFDKSDTRTTFLRDWVSLIKSSGIRSIDGSVEVVTNHFDPWPVIDTWTYEDLGNYYGAGVFSVALFDNSVDLYFSSPLAVGKPVIFQRAWPSLQGIELNNQIVSGQGGDNAYIFQSPTSRMMIARGTIPAGKNNFVVKASMADPPVTLANLLASMLDSSGIAQTTSPFVSHTLFNGSDVKDLFVHQSPTLARIVEQTNFYSVNLFAEHLLREVGLLEGGTGSTASGLVAIHKFCVSKGMNTSGISIVDGCGLSRFNLVTAAFMVDFLVYFKNRSPYSDIFYNSLPLAGKDGTMEVYGRKSSIAGKVRAKTGSMSRIKNLAGYIETRSGKILAFAFIANNQCCSSSKVKLIQESILKVLYENY